MCLVSSVEGSLVAAGKILKDQGSLFSDKLLSGELQLYGRK